MYVDKFGFSDNSNISKYLTKYDQQLSFYHQYNEFTKLIPRTENTKIKNNSVYKNAEIFIIHCQPSILMNVIILKMKK